MKQPDINARKEYVDIVSDSVSVVPLRGTRRSVRLRWIKPYTLERLTRLWLERDIASAKADTGAQVMQDLSVEPHFAFKEAALMILNHDLKIRFFYWFYWRWLAFRYAEEQIVPVIMEGKKKLPLEAHYATIIFSMDMNEAYMKMTKKEAEQYQAELLLESKRLSSRTSPDTGGQGGGSSDGSATSGTGAS